MKNPFEPKPMPRNPTPGSEGSRTSGSGGSATRDANQVGGRKNFLQRAIERNMERNRAEADRPSKAERPVTGRRTGENSRDWRRRQNTGIDRDGRST
ncbi:MULTISPECIES: hypothetical protein [Nocardiopsis]|uniref:hypothetical protein n=1 Tax=Nocardiopsis TaxID=2013 RepID=UPI000322BD28|nr:hypothetical protein [Nocardiopsis dassonvillei]